MCLSLSKVIPSGQWNWEGDEIVYEPIVPNARRIPRTKNKYDIDIREFILTKGNSVIKRAIGEILDTLRADEKALFQSHQQGSFDFRVRKIIKYMNEHIHYKKRDRGFDYWLYPDETIENRGGDCEDRAFLLASLMLSSGISSYVVRVILGKIYDLEKDKPHDHIWVMYKNEAGIWMRLEPQLFSPQLKYVRKIESKDIIGRTKQYEFIPYFGFNNDHMWRINSNIKKRFSDYLHDREFFEGYDPEFYFTVHFDIIDLALNNMLTEDRTFIKQLNLELDLPLGYNPLDHFDNGYIKEGWDLLEGRLSKKGNLTEFAYAIHSAADFYSHSSYAHFAGRGLNGKSLILFNGDLSSVPFDSQRYRTLPFDLNDKKRFTVNDHYYTNPDRNEAINYCTNMKIISGRSAQTKDPHQSWAEKIFFQIPYDLRKAPNFPERGCLPHHDEIAVDEPSSNGKVPSGHTLYRTVQEYDEQYNLRVNTAVLHTKELYKKWKSPV